MINEWSILKRSVILNDKLIIYELIIHWTVDTWSLIIIMKYPKSIQKLINEFSNLPTVGPKTAERYVFYLLNAVLEHIQPSWHRLYLRWIHGRFCMHGRFGAERCLYFRWHLLSAMQLLLYGVRNGHWLVHLSV